MMSEEYRRNGKLGMVTVVGGTTLLAGVAAMLLGATSAQVPARLWDSARVPEAVRQSKPWQRFVWEYEQRAYPDTYIPDGALARAADQIRRFHRTHPQLRSSARWTSLGPSPLWNPDAGDPFVADTSLAGRVSALAVNPDKSKEIIAGGAQGGIYRSTNGGKSWKAAGDDLKTLAVGSIAYAPSNTRIIYVGTGESVFSGDAYSGVGVYKSSNGGRSWKLVNKTSLMGLEIGALVVNPNNAKQVVLASSRWGRAQQWFGAAPGIWRSTDGGVTWSRTLAGHATDVVADPKDFNTLYAAIGNLFGSSSNGVYRSTDGGKTFRKLSGPWAAASTGRIELAVAPSKSGVLYVGIQDNNSFGLLGLYKSTNATARQGARKPKFKQIDVTSMGTGTGKDTYCGSQCWYDHVLLVDPREPNTLWAGGIYLWRLREGKWDLMLPGHVDVHALAFAGTQQLFVGNDGGVFSTKDGGSTWTSHNATLSLIQFYQGSISGLDFVLGGTQDNGTSVRDAGLARGGATDPWTRVVGGDGGYNAISSTDPANDWAASSQNLGLVRTTDGGQTFRDVTGAIDTTNAPFIAPFAKCPGNDNIFYAATNRVWRADDFFSAAVPNWKDVGPSLVSGDTVSAIAVSGADSKCKTVAIGTARGDLFVSKNGGKKWNDVDKGNHVPMRRITDLAFSPDNKNILVITLSGFDESGTGDPGHVFRTTSATKKKPAWTDISPPVDLPFQSVVFQPGSPAKLWAGSDLGVWEQVASAKGGVDWTHHGPDTGLPNVAVYDLRATSDGVVAFTHGRGAWVLHQTNRMR